MSRISGERKNRLLYSGEARTRASGVVPKPGRQQRGLAAPGPPESNPDQARYRPPERAEVSGQSTTTGITHEWFLILEFSVRELVPRRSFGPGAPLAAGVPAAPRGLCRQSAPGPIHGLLSGCAALPGTKSCPAPSRQWPSRTVHHGPGKRGRYRRVSPMHGTAGLPAGHRNRPAAESLGGLPAAGRGSCRHDFVWKPQEGQGNGFRRVSGLPEAARGSR